MNIFNRFFIQFIRSLRGNRVWYALPLGDEPVLKIKSNADLTVALHRLENDFAEMCEHFREIEKIVSIIDKK